MTLPGAHPQRFELNDEVHARPPLPLRSPLRLSYLALFSRGNPAVLEKERRHLSDLIARYGGAQPRAGTNHHMADFGDYTLKWERHTEFSRYVIVAPDPVGEPFASTALSLLPPEWIAQIPGELMVAAHVALVPPPAGALDYDAIAARHFDGNVLVGSHVTGGVATALLDFRVRPDGFSRVLVYDRGLAPRQAGRVVQRILEIDTYRMVALLALPVARELSPGLSRSERELAEITTALENADAEGEPVLLDRLTRLEAEIEKREADNHYRFSAAAAYYDLVQRRIEELREERIDGLQTLEEFMQRRLAPAMNTCRSIAERQDAMSRRVSRVTSLLSTRVGITRERQNQALLESMNSRAETQLRLQTTVEGLSIAVVTYYAVGLIHYLAKGAKSLGLGVEPDLVAALSIPLVALAVAFGARRVRRLVVDRRAGGDELS